MIKIKVSFERQQELETVLKVLEPITLSCKVPKTNEGRFKKAYINVREPTKLVNRRVS